MQIAILIAITSTAIAVVLIFCAFFIARAFIRLGMQTAKGIVPPKIKSPVEVVKEAIAKPDPATTELLKGYANMMAYNGDVPKEES